MKLFLFEFSLFSLAISIAGAAQIRLEGRNKDSPGLHRRALLAGTTDLTDQGDILYFTDITLGSPPTTISVNIDTGRFERLCSQRSCFLTCLLAPTCGSLPTSLIV